ncbi:uncharacterized protein [Centruroides vittatus]|uniref:uncharacterized protein isoform X1 n=1 Tax=Centruroides vittatus TaxID=120091 RepID=UPI0035108398
MDDRNKTITVLTSDGKEIKVNKSHLRDKSEIFRQMLANNKISRIRVKECHKNFLTLLKYIGLEKEQIHPRSFHEAFEIYIGLERVQEYPQSFHEAFEMYKIGRRYKIKHLEENSKRHIMTTGTEFSTKVHDAAVNFRDAELEFYCWRQFRHYTHYHITGEEFIHSGKRTIERFVTCPIYTNLSELSIFTGLYLWARIRVLNNGFLPDSDLIRQEMKPFLPHIRFLCMTRDELEKVFMKNILNEIEVKEIKNYFNNPSDTSSITNINTDTKKRTTDNYINLFHYHNHRDFFINEERLLTDNHMFFCDLSVHAKCYLVKLYLPIHHDANVNTLLVAVKTYQMKEEKLAYLTTIYSYCGPTGEVNISPSAIVFEKCCRYIIRVNFSPLAITPENRITISTTAHFYADKSEVFSEVCNKLYLITKLFF